jgi:hypothetical protein
MKEAVGLFMSLATQWRWTGAGLAGAFRTGLDYSVLAPTAASLDITMTPDLFVDIQIMETAALGAWSRNG